MMYFETNSVLNDFCSYDFFFKVFNSVTIINIISLVIVSHSDTAATGSRVFKVVERGRGNNKLILKQHLAATCNVSFCKNHLLAKEPEYASVLQLSIIRCIVDMMMDKSTGAADYSSHYHKQ